MKHLSIHVRSTYGYNEAHLLSINNHDLFRQDFNIVTLLRSCNSGSI